MELVRAYQMKEKQIKSGSSSRARIHRLRLGSGCKLELQTTCRAMETRIALKEVAVRDGCLG